MHGGTLQTHHASALASTSSSIDPLGLQALQTVQVKEELKTQILTREGVYHVLPLPEYARAKPQLAQMQQQPNGSALDCRAATIAAPVRVSFLNLSDSNVVRPSLIENASALPPAGTPQEAAGHRENGADRQCSADDADPSVDRICFNVGKELFVYPYKGVHSSANDVSKPIDKRVYKGTAPSCHQFNAETASSTSASLIIGFTAGQVQLIDPLQKDFSVSRLFNEERAIEKSPITCLRWVPDSPMQFLVAHTTGCLYLYSVELQCAQTPPSYQLVKQGERYAIFSPKSKTPKNPIYKWQIGEGTITQFAFSSDLANLMLATVGNDGFLRVFNYSTFELLCCMKSYFGSLLCLSWSPDNKLIATGGEDDLLTIYSFAEKRVICRGQGHKSWISQVAFDPYVSLGEESEPAAGIATPGEFEDEASQRIAGKHSENNHHSSVSRLSFVSFGTSFGGIGSGGSVKFYRIGSVGYDTQLCFWDITDDILKCNLTGRHRNSTVAVPAMPPAEVSRDPETSTSSAAVKEKRKTRFHRRGLSIAAKLTGSGGDRNRDSSAAARALALEEAKFLGTKSCPRIDEVPMIEPLVCKKISHERLTVLEFRKDCFVTACQEGLICTWARPGKSSVEIVRHETTRSPTATFTCAQVETLSNGFTISAQQPFNSQFTSF